MCIIKRMQSYSKGMVKQNKMKHIFGGQRVKDEKMIYRCHAPTILSVTTVTDKLYL